jgi:SAM-dependent methyltransferase
MHGLPFHDGERTIDWGRASDDYAVFRPGPPTSFYTRLAAFGVGLKGQAILDLGTGTGVLARQFARQGADVFGVDISPEQVEIAQQLAREEMLSAKFAVVPAEGLPWKTAEFDLATANQCWLYFDKEQTIRELRRVLKPHGWLVTSHFSWLPRRDEIARQSESLVLKFNPDWSAGDWEGVIPNFPEWAEPDFNLRGIFYYDEPIAFTRETWQGRIRACRGVGASMSADEILAFDAEHERLLKETTPDTFTVLHRIAAQIFEFKDCKERRSSSRRAPVRKQIQ